jgi:hypothetical protein
MMTKLFGGKEGKGGGGLESDVLKLTVGSHLHLTVRRGDRVMMAAKARASLLQRRRRRRRQQQQQQQQESLSASRQLRAPNMHHLNRTCLLPDRNPEFVAAGLPSLVAPPVCLNGRPRRKLKPRNRGQTQPDNLRQQHQRKN